MNDQLVTTPQAYGLTLARNVAAARTQLRLKQSSVSARMNELGWENFHPQTVSEIEAGRRSIRADELLGLALALETTVRVLTAAPPGTLAVALPSGDLLGAQRVLEQDGSVSWDGDRLKLSPPSSGGQIIDSLIAERRREADLLEAYREDLRRASSGNGDSEGK